MAEPPDVEHIAGIARLALTREERSRLAAEAAAILAHFEAVMAAPEGGPEGGPEGPAGAVEPRADEVVAPDAAQVEAIVAQFPRKDGRLAKAPGGL